MILTSYKVEHRRVVLFLTTQAIHDGMNCKQYQEQVKQESETNAEARRTKEMLEVRRYIFILFPLCGAVWFSSFNFCCSKLFTCSLGAIHHTGIIPE
jgi:RanBP-type and C3HC4-type zinc finger-containing protein 1